MTHPEHEDFAEGQEAPEHSAELPEPNFARGQSVDPDPGAEGSGNFDEGQKEVPEAPEHFREGSFADGQELNPDLE
jgi:hypothetical protein